MTKTQPNATSIMTKILVPQSYNAIFAEWQAKLNAKITTFDGFISLEILSPLESVQAYWVIIQRFRTADSLRAWIDSSERTSLLEELKQTLGKNSTIQEIETDPYAKHGGITEVFVTKVNPAMDEAYRAWLAKIHQAETTFEGFQGMYVQQPAPDSGNCWITLLHFDTAEHLDLWLQSSVRHAILDEAEVMIQSLESHRMTSPFAGWFANLSNATTSIPVWKQTLIVLLVLFPLVMLELKFLSPLTAPLNSSLATFIGNAISVSLVSWPMIPIAFYGLKWWLTPKTSLKSQFKNEVAGLATVLLLYTLEIAVFWNLL